MSVVGLDVGNENCIIGVARQRGIDVILNDESSRETPTMVSFSEKQRFLGTAAAATATMNPKNTISQIKRLIGRKFKDPEVQKDLYLLPFNVSEGPDGGPLINVQYMNEKSTFTPTQILGMILYNLKSIAEKTLGATIVDCVIGIPIYFSELQRRAYIDAATIASLHPLRLMHETTATALAYGIYKSDLPENEPINVVFVDIGHANMQVCVVAFKKGHLKVLGHSFDRSLGGRDFDEVIFNYFVDKFREEYKVDVLSNIRACQRLRTACEKMKKVLSANAEATLNIECLMDEKDVQGHMKREEFEQLAIPILERVKAPCEKALANANLTLDKIGAIEVIGSGSRVPAVLKIIASYFGKDPSHTLNASECIARGCTLQCAMLSPTFKVRDFEIQDFFPFPIALSWKGQGSQKNIGDGMSNSICVFAKGNALPSAKLLTFYRCGTFYIDALYANMSDLPLGTTSKISTYEVGPINPSKPERAMLKLKIRLNLHGILSLEQATLIEEDEPEVSFLSNKNSEQECKEASPMDVEMQKYGHSMDGLDSNAEGTETFQSNDHDHTFKGTRNSSPPFENKLNRLEIEQAIEHEVVKRRKTKKTDVSIHEIIIGGLPTHELIKAVEKESHMALQDRLIEETKEKKNAVETYVYEMRTKLFESLQDFTTDHEREELATKLQQTEFWLYEEGEDESKGVYMAKLAELKKLGDPFVERQKEDKEREQALIEIFLSISNYREAILSNDVKYDHIQIEEKEKVLLECQKVEDWAHVKKLQQDSLSKTNNPILLAMDIKKKMESLDRTCKPIMTKARPIVSPRSNPISLAKEHKETSPKDSPSGAAYAHTSTKEDGSSSMPHDNKESSLEGERIEVE